MENENLPKSPEVKVELKADLTNTIERAYDDSVQKPLKSTSKAATTFLDFFHNTIMYPMQKYNIYVEGNLKKYAMKVQNRIEQEIPPENLVEAKVNILGPTIEGLKYNLDEEHIKEMFTNILISDMDNRKQDKVLPSYIEIVKQLSQDDAKFLKLLNEKKLVKDLPITRLTLVDKNSHFFSYLSIYFICLSDGQTIEVPPIILDNLIRLRIVEIPSDEYFANTNIYDKVFENLKNSIEFSMFNNIPNKYLNNEKRKMKITSFGKNFIDICLS